MDPSQGGTASKAERVGISISTRLYNVKTNCEGSAGGHGGGKLGDRIYGKYRVRIDVFEGVAERGQRKSSTGGCVVCVFSIIRSAVKITSIESRSAGF
jgi:hypothetical protein